MLATVQKFGEHYSFGPEQWPSQAFNSDNRGKFKQTITRALELAGSETWLFCGFRTPDKTIITDLFVGQTAQEMPYIITSEMPKHVHSFAISGSGKLPENKDVARFLWLTA